MSSRKILREHSSMDATVDPYSISPSGEVLYHVVNSKKDIFKGYLFALTFTVIGTIFNIFYLPNFGVVGDHIDTFYGGGALFSEAPMWLFKILNFFCFIFFVFMCYFCAIIVFDWPRNYLSFYDDHVMHWGLRKKIMIHDIDEIILHKNFAFVRSKNRVTFRIFYRLAGEDRSELEEFIANWSKSYPVKKNKFVPFWTGFT